MPPPPCCPPRSLQHAAGWASKSPALELGRCSASAFPGRWWKVRVSHAPTKTQPAKDRKETEKDVPGGERHNSEGKAQRRWAYMTRTTPRLRPVLPYFSQGQSRSYRLLPDLWVTTTPALDSPTGATGGTSTDCKSRGARAPVCSSDRPDYLTASAAGRAVPGYKSHAVTDPVDERVPVRSSDRLPCSATSTTGKDGTSDAVEGRGDRVRFTARSPTTSALTACFLDAGTATRRA